MLYTHEIKRQVYVRQLGKRRVILRHLAVIHAVGLIRGVQRGARGFMLSIEQHNGVRGPHHAYYFHKRAHKADGAMHGPSAFAHYARGHTIEHLEQQIAPVNNKQLLHGGLLGVITA